MLNYEYYNFSEIENTPTKKQSPPCILWKWTVTFSKWLASTRTIGVPKSWVYPTIMAIILVGQMVMVAYLQIKPHLWDWFFAVDLLVFFRSPTLCGVLHTSHLIFFIVFIDLRAMLMLQQQNQAGFAWFHLWPGIGIIPFTKTRVRRILGSLILTGAKRREF